MQSLTLQFLLKKMQIVVSYVQDKGVRDTSWTEFWKLGVENYSGAPKNWQR